MTTITLTTAEAKEEFAELIHRVSHAKERIILTRRGKEVAAIVPLEDFYLLQSSQDKSDVEQAVAALKEAREQGTLTLAELKEKIGQHS
jgi:prevent-host-death family protein